MIDRASLEEILTTPVDFIRWGASVMARAAAQGQLSFGHGADNPLDEAIRLVLRSLSLPLDTPDRLLNGKLLLAERHCLVDRFKRRVEQRIPLSYLLGEARFAGIDFHVDERVLIPRSPIAELIESHFTPWIVPDQVNNVLDLCTGSACIAIAIAEYMLWVSVVASDASDGALEVAAKNVADQELQQRVTLHHGDLFTGLEQQWFELIVTNPPHVDAATLAALPQEFLTEPHSGLAGGEDGLDLVVKILVQAVDHLVPDGVLVVEVGASAERLEQLFPEVPWCWVEFSRGGDGVFVIDRATVAEHHARFVEELVRRDPRGQKQNVTIQGELNSYNRTAMGSR